MSSFCLAVRFDGMQLVIVLSCGFDNANMAQSCLFVRLSCNNFLTLCHNLLSFADFKGQNVTSCCYISSFTRIHWPAGRNFVYLKKLRKCGKLKSDDMKELMLMIAVAAVLVSCSGGAAAAGEPFGAVRPAPPGAGTHRRAPAAFRLRGGRSLYIRNGREGQRAGCAAFFLPK